MAQVTIFSYKGSNVTFNRGDCVMVNATEMAKSFKKRPNDWFNLPSTKAFLSVLTETRKSCNADFQAVLTIKGGADLSRQGTWLHEDVALEFARWLSPEFAIWCNDRIKELLRYGMTATETTIDSIIADPESGIKLLQALKQEREAKALETKRADAAEQQVVTLSHEIEEMKPKVSYYDMILNNKSTVLTTQIALDYGMSAKVFNAKLYELRVQHKVNDQWILYAPYISQGYVHSKPVEITHRDGTKAIKYNSEWTQKGRLFLYDLLKKNNIIPLIEQ